MNKRYLTKRGYADAVGLGIGSVTKAITNGWLEVSEFPSIEGEFIDVEQYPIKEYFSYIATCQKKSRERTHFNLN